MLLPTELDSRETEQGEQSKVVNTIGFEDMMIKMVAEVLDYFWKRPSVPYVAFITGQIGSGKTAFIKHFIKALEDDPQTETYKHPHGRLPIFASTVNAETRLHFLNVWRPIFQMLTKYYCKKMGLKKNEFVARVVKEKGLTNQHELIFDICGVDLQQIHGKLKEELQKPQVTPLADPIAFVKTPDFGAEHKEALKDFFVFLFKICVNESSGVKSSDESSERSLSQRPSQSSSSSSSANEAAEQFIFVIDNANKMDAFSWQLFYDIII